VRRSGVEEFARFLGTLDSGLDEIRNYFLERQTSGPLESFNTRVKVLKCRGYGIFAMGRIFQRLTLDTTGYEQFGLT
jgi:transposase